MLKSRGFWIGIVVSLVFIGLFVRSTDFGEVRRAFRDANYWWVVASLPVYFAGLWIRTIRWQYLLRPVRRVKTLRLYPVVIIGLMANNLIPARAGELARAYVLGVRERVSKTTALGTIAVDRLFDGVTLVPMMLIVAALAGDRAHFDVGVGDWKTTLNFEGLGLVMSALFGIAIAMLAVLAFSQRGRDALHRLVHAVAPGRLKPKVEYLLHSFFEGLSALRSPLDLGVALVMSTASWLLEATMYYMIAIGFGIDEPFYVFLLLTAAANLAIAIVASQGGVGPFELVVKETLVSFGVGPQVAAAYAIGLHAVLLFPVIALGLYLMWSMKLTFGDMLKSSQETGDGEMAAGEAPGGARPVRAAKPAVEAEPS
ncbi:MAG TPA: lysylphosphatidylglycerol synthase transmembrane domain-containing protein [Dehalococcoidia bacterium]|nr:lysylphosphatidylglycerol synthase transmembrane domain-containing protein [Dehalococcoidia bacterium]